MELVLAFSCKHFGISISYDPVSQDLVSRIFFLKNHCVAQEGSKSAIFALIDLHPLQFHVGIVSAPPDPRICLKMAKKKISVPFECLLREKITVQFYPENFNTGHFA